eukprot:NODE_3320_length_1373_cov_54.953600_g2886_i0.p1 GENE.NODE_3320_length_1373_cov_54.953600_g2886_i0~~NODE_3320_length_1373_cov_54.953600_g2886_i0.p1  ORF type:complete len:383 (+),score=75.63 NODE_3320_length_1373_cov_54.953600_g2886_i0:54-1151(+)
MKPSYISLGWKIASSGLSDLFTKNGAKRVGKTKTDSRYKLICVDNHPAVVPCRKGTPGGNITLDLWDVDPNVVPNILNSSPISLQLTNITLENGQSALGLITNTDEDEVLDITGYGSWNEYLKRDPKDPIVASPGQVNADPYPWPYNGSMSITNTMLIIIDMQVDFCGKGGYVDRMGYDIELTRRPIEPLQRVLAAFRKKGLPVLHTREGHRPELVDLPSNKQWRSRRIGAGIGDLQSNGDRMLVRGYPGWEIISELSPIAGEPIVDKSGKGSFFATDLEAILRTMKISNIILTGVTTDVCVSTTMREANDRGFECMVLSDCTAASKYPNHLHALDTVTTQGGVFGTVATSNHVLEALKCFPDKN